MEKQELVKLLKECRKNEQWIQMGDLLKTAYPHYDIRDIRNYIRNHVMTEFQRRCCSAE